MIHYVTSVSRPIRDIESHAVSLVLKLGTGSARIVCLQTVPHIEEANEAEKLITLNTSWKGHVVCPSAAELPLLRLCRAVREQRLKADDLQVVVLTKATGNSVEPRTLRVDEDGEFIDRWPEGFFAAREPELF